MKIFLDKQSEDFIKNQIKSGAFKNTDEVIQAALQLLEDRENVEKLRQTLVDGESCGDAKLLNIEQIINEAKKEMDSDQILSEAVCSLSDFCQNAITHLDQLAENGGIKVLTVNNQAKGVVMSTKSFDLLVELAVLPESLDMIDRSMKDVKAERGKEFRKAIKEIKNSL